MARTTHHRVRDHQGNDLTTNIELDGALGAPATTASAATLQTALTNLNAAIAAARTLSNSISGIPGEPGEDGAMGPPGPPGPAGATGAPGAGGSGGGSGYFPDDGDEGPMGPPGPRGDIGLTGPTGPTGSNAGFGVPSGYIPDEGEEGQMGPPGPPGPTGPSGGGGLVLLEQHTASSSAELDFTTCISATYDVYQIEFVEVIPASNGQPFVAQVSTDGGSSWDTTSPHYYSNGFWTANATWAAQGGGPSQVAIYIAHDVGNSGILGVVGSVRIYPNGTSQRWMVGEVNYLPSAANRACMLVNSDYEQGPYNAIRFLFGSGNIASGTIRIYGIAK